MGTSERPPTNMQYLRWSNKKLKEGDIFTFRMPSGVYLFGRVIAVDLKPPRAPTHASNLVYIYDVQSDDRTLPVDELIPSRLLIPPFYTNKTAWTDGLFETVENRGLGAEDVLNPHCFWDSLKKKYLNADGEVLEQRVEPCGRWVLFGYSRVDDLVSEALGIPLVPDPKRKSKK